MDLDLGFNQAHGLNDLGVANGMKVKNAPRVRVPVKAIIFFKGRITIIVEGPCGHNMQNVLWYCLFNHPVLEGYNETQLNIFFS